MCRNLYLRGLPYLAYPAPSACHIPDCCHASQSLAFISGSQISIFAWLNSFMIRRLFFLHSLGICRSSCVIFSFPARKNLN